MLGVVHDEHSPDIELHAAPDVAVPEVERSAGRNEQEQAVLQVAFDPAVDPGEGVLEVVGDVLVEAVVVVVVELALVAGPHRGSGVDGLLVLAFVRFRVVSLSFSGHQDRYGDMVGVLAHDASQAVTVQELVLAVAQVQHHLRAPGLDFNGLDGELALAARFPAHALHGGTARAARGDGDLVGDDEARVEPDAELPDELGVLRAVAGQGFEELPGAGAGDGPEIGRDLLAGHSDAIVANRDGAGIGIERDPDPELAVAFVESIVGQRLEPELVRGVGRIGDQLPEKDLLVAVERVNHEIQQLLDLGLEPVGLLRLHLGHHAVPPGAQLADPSMSGYGAAPRRFQASAGSPSRRRARTPPAACRRPRP